MHEAVQSVQTVNFCEQRIFANWKKNKYFVKIFALRGIMPRRFFCSFFFLDIGVLRQEGPANVQKNVCNEFCQNENFAQEAFLRPMACPLCSFCLHVFPYSLCFHYN